ncbi:hypothetical protein OG571_03835 [Streptomyces sp. NBC_01369]|uniref:hypothetical protein n=1 Tax=unclassified Streptomyces TaxID=2593676 RepID=UPI00224D0EF6|nr:MULTISPECIES: hypothetical protein [unclassified Streptomyces]MCX4869234.1 hypothetical protein [Streptomyces sp. NBC_00906]MCX4900472.1 hypothetical protein [Streptomyces sp. NBC_00892]
MSSDRPTSHRPPGDRPTNDPLSSDRPTGCRPARASRGRAAGLLTALLLACTSLLGTGAPARAETAGTGPTAATIAESLATDPVHVDPSYAAAVDPAQEQALVDRIAATGLPIKVVLVPLKKGDAFDGDAHPRRGGQGTAR